MSNIYKKTNHLVYKGQIITLKQISIKRYKFTLKPQFTRTYVLHCRGVRGVEGWEVVCGIKCVCGRGVCKIYIILKISDRKKGGWDIFGISKISIYLSIYLFMYLSFQNCDYVSSYFPTLKVYMFFM